MGVLTAVIIGVVGLILAFLMNLIPIKIFSKVVPICYIPKVNCVHLYGEIKSYIIVIILAIVIGFLPLCF